MARELSASEVREADIVDLAHDGRGVARVDGKAVFIEGALPGERVRFRVIKRRRQMDEAGLVKALKALADKKRLRMAREIASAGELSCTAVKAHFHLSQPTISHHLKILADKDFQAGRLSTAFMERFATRPASGRLAEAG